MVELSAISPSSLVGVAIATSFAYLIGLVIYRLYLHPLAKFPGPKLAAITLWYEFYHDVVRGGQYVFKIDELHKTYGKTPVRLTFCLFSSSSSPLQYSSALFSSFS